MRVQSLEVWRRERTTAPTNAKEAENYIFSYTAAIASHPAD